MGRRLLITISSIGQIVGFSASCSAASFDCAHVVTNEERAICSNPVLSDLDSKLGAAFQAARVLAENPDALLADQREWIKTRNLKCGPFPLGILEVSKVRCLELITTSRISELLATTGLASFMVQSDKRVVEERASGPSEPEPSLAQDAPDQKPETSIPAPSEHGHRELYDAYRSVWFVNYCSSYITSYVIDDQVKRMRSIEQADESSEADKRQMREAAEAAAARTMNDKSITERNGICFLLALGGELSVPH